MRVGETTRLIPDAAEVDTPRASPGMVAGTGGALGGLACGGDTEADRRDTAAGGPPVVLGWIFKALPETLAGMIQGSTPWTPSLAPK